MTSVANLWSLFKYLSQHLTFGIYLFEKRSTAPLLFITLFSNVSLIGLLHGVYSRLRRPKIFGAPLHSVRYAGSKQEIPKEIDMEPWVI
jgi:hypothetical protein